MARVLSGVRPKDECGYASGGKGRIEVTIHGGQRRQLSAVLNWSGLDDRRRIIRNPAKLHSEIISGIVDGYDDRLMALGIHECGHANISGTRAGSNSHGSRPNELDELTDRPVVRRNLETREVAA
jgi:hypothetical protein